MGIPNNEELKRVHYNCYKLIKYHYPEFFDFLLNEYKDYKYKTFSEIVYCYYHNIKEHPKCPVCGKPLRFYNFSQGYAKYCSNACINADPHMKDIIKASYLEKYGVENISQLESIKERKKKTCREHFGVDHPMQSKEVMDKSRKTCLEVYGYERAAKADSVKVVAKKTFEERYGGTGFASPEINEKIKQTNLERYGTEFPSQLEEIKEKSRSTTLEHYGVAYYFKTDKFKKFQAENQEEFIKRQHETKRKNNTFHTSQCEQDVRQWLDDNDVKYEYQYKSEEYPFLCDFYFPESSLYFEIQGFWAHGKHPFNPDSENDLATVELWKSKNSKEYENSIKIWTKSDPYKRAIAEQNNLNWHEIFSDDSNTIIEELKRLL